MSTFSLVSLLLAGCSDGEDAPAAAGAGLPEGASAWTGSMEVGGQPFLTDFELDLAGGDVQGTITFRDDPAAPAGFGAGTFEVRGTHEPESGLLALAPYGWRDEPNVASELLGFIGAYDPDTEELVGTIVDYATGDENMLLGGPARATKVSGDGEPVAVGDRANGLSAGARTFAGTLLCSGPQRDVEGDLSYDGVGAVEGTMTVGDPGVDAALGTFAFTGVHNPSTGGLTLVPGLWTAYTRSVLTFFIHGRVDVATGAYRGDQLTNLDSCPRDTWDAVID